MNDSRSRIRYSVCSSERLWSDCSTTILNFKDRIIGLAAGIALALLGLRLRHRLDVSAEILPSHDFLDRLQRIALGTDRLQSALNIEKTSLPHDPLAPSAHYRVRSPSQIRGELARGIFRGALPSEHHPEHHRRCLRKGRHPPHRAGLDPNRVRAGAPW